MLTLSSQVKFVKGIGPQLAELLNEKRIFTVEDLLYHLPFRYEDRANPRPMDELKDGETTSIIGEVRGSVLLRTRKMPIFEMTVGQGNQSIKCMWFHGAYLKDRFQLGQTVALYGRVEGSRSRPGNFKMIQPQFEILPDSADAEAASLEVGRIVPVYESLGGNKLSSRWLRRIVYRLLNELKDVRETLPQGILKRLEMPGRTSALRSVHFPEAETPLSQLQSATSAAHRRLIFEELFYLELGLELKRRRMRERPGIGFETNDKVRKAIKQALPFHPTGAQKRVFAEIAADMRRRSPMRRLLQGDVGSGKTIIAIEAALVAIENGYQAALMAPTEILATQHYLAARKLLERSDNHYNVSLLTGSLELDIKRATRGRIMRGETNLVIGTHALIEEKVEFARLGLVVVDEQHRFGVQQRFRLIKKPNDAEPDVLVMTATPIPRTLALTIYGDLDVSCLDEMPPGRTPILTRRTVEEKSAEVWKFVRAQVAKGQQTYIVYPIIEGVRDDQPELDFAHDVAPESRPEEISEKKKTTLFAKATGEGIAKRALRSATAMYEELRTTHLAGLRMGLLHGRLDAQEKDVTMRRFQRGEIDVLVATTVIEVGVDVPNASVMVIEHAERFGLAQMHQLRGRVGRGAAKSYCVLMTGGPVTPEAEARLDAMVRTQDGFELAEIDLEQRGPGEFFGTRQAGLPDFRIANMLRDRKLLELAKQEAVHFALEPDPQMPRSEIDAVWARLREHWQRRYGLVEV
jgi:ATP-dependent DNA helicase RecG